MKRLLGKRRCYGCGSLDHIRTSFACKSIEGVDNTTTQNVKAVAGSNTELNVEFEEVDDLAVFSAGGEDNINIEGEESINIAHDFPTPPPWMTMK